MPYKINGNDVIRKLARNKSTRGLSAQLKRLRDLYSIRYDLRRALRAVDMAVAIAASRGSDFTAITSEDSINDAALAALAINCYARCTDTESARSRFDPRRFYSAEQKKKHSDIIAIRNQSIAHFGTSLHTGGQWADDQLFLYVDHGELSYGALVQQWGYRGIHLAALRELIPIALDGLQDDRLKLIGKIDEGFIALESTISDLSSSFEMEFIQIIPRGVDEDVADWTPTGPFNEP